MLDGGAGSDNLNYYSSTAAVAVNLALDAASGGYAQGDTISNFENVSGSQFNDTLTGNAASNGLYGYDGNDVLSGGGDYDSMSGGNGSDTLLGDAGNDYLSGDDGNDVLRGGAGGDSLYGGSGNDTASYYTGSVGIVVDLTAGTGSGGDAQGDFLNGIENISGSQGNDSLVGNTGANVLQGWNGNDVLTGAGGRDTLTGGAGADRFVYGSAAQSPVGAGADLITDFSHAQGDKIDLAAIDANTTAAGDQAFTFIGSGAYTGVAGQLRYAQTSVNTTIVAGDLDGNGTSDFHIVLSGHIALVAGDFVL
ncbi:hypothetical protein BWR60_35440 [Inquilinus limosus]|uniref:Uncharacterized protein n=1 Tax=Inquilinus limosus TaxID=171674 RepID=A0A211YSW9_9PROT|nr:hypothetical protein BWR60_35440 [Inquilinus limosus]